MAVQGDDFVCLPDDNGLNHIDTLLKSKCTAKDVGTLGFEDSDAKNLRLWNSVFRGATEWHPRHLRRHVLLRPTSRWKWQSRAAPCLASLLLGVVHVCRCGRVCPPTFEFTGRGRQLARGQSEEEVCLLRRRPSALHNARDHDGQVTLRMLFRVSCTTLNNTAFVREIDVAESAWTIETEVLEMQSCVSARGLSVLSIVGTTSCMEWCVEHMRVCEWFTLMTKIMSGLA